MTPWVIGIVVLDKGTYLIFGLTDNLILDNIRDTSVLIFFFLFKPNPTFQGWENPQTNLWQF